jgi:hypothetical protein
MLLVRTKTLLLTCSADETEELFIHLTKSEVESFEMQFFFLKLNFEVQ